MQYNAFAVMVLLLCCCEEKHSFCCCTPPLHQVGVGALWQQFAAFGAAAAGWLKGPAVQLSKVQQTQVTLLLLGNICAHMFHHNWCLLQCRVYS
jgi:hypothetical protein